MSSLVVIRGEPERGGATRGTFAPPHSGQRLPHSISHRERISAILAHTVVPVRRTVRASTALGRWHRDKSVRINSRRPFEASGGLLLGNARFQFLQEPSSRVADRFHLSNSLRVAPASCLQCATGRIPDERKPTARDGNLTARERKNAC